MNIVNVDYDGLIPNNVGLADDLVDAAEVAHIVKGYPPLWTGYRGYGRAAKRVSK